MSKEEILIKKGLLTEFGTLFKPIGEAMDEYAQQEAIGFLKWLIEQKDKQYLYLYSSIGFVFVATKNEEKAYKLYLKSKIKQP